MRRILASVGLATILACILACSSGTASSSGDGGSSPDCEAIAQSIRDAAVKPRLPKFPNGWDGNGDGKPDAIGICTTTDPTIVKDFGNACAQLKACNGSTQP